MMAMALKAAGAYVALTYYIVNIKTGEKKFITKNITIMKIG